MPIERSPITGTLLLSRFAVDSGSGSASGSTTARLLSRESGLFRIIDGEYRAYLAPSGGFVEISRSSYNPFTRNGFKIHLSVKTAELEKALNVVCPLLVSDDSPVKICKVTHPGNMTKIPGASAGSTARVIEGAQITIYCCFDDDLTKVTQLLFLLYEALTKANIGEGIIPKSDLPLGPYFSGRCEVALEEDGASNNPTDRRYYVPADEAMGETNYRVHLFHFIRLCVLAESIHMRLDAAESAKARAGREILFGFLAKHSGSTASHNELIRLLYAELNEVYKEIDESLLVQFQAFAKLLSSLSKLDSSRYNKPSTAYQRAMMVEQRRRRMHAEMSAAIAAEGKEEPAAEASGGAAAAEAKDKGPAVAASGAAGHAAARAYTDEDEARLSA